MQCAVTFGCFNPRSPREERRCLRGLRQTGLRFNPRSPRGSDIASHPLRRGSKRRFNPRSPREERRVRAAYEEIDWWFQSTLPSRGATRPALRATGNIHVSIHAPLARSDRRHSTWEPAANCFNPRSPREERPVTSGQVIVGISVSIHAPLARSDFGDGFDGARRQAFQSTLPSRGATRNFSLRSSSLTGFNPRSPREERQRWC